MEHNKLLERVQSIASVYNLAEHPSVQNSPNYQEVARAMRNLANELFGELVDEELGNSYQECTLQEPGDAS